jgi:hypothetical protein
MAEKTKSTKKSSTQKAAAGSRKLKPSSYKSFRLQKRIRHQHSELSGAFRLFKQSMVPLRKNWKLFMGITLIYGLLTIVLVRGIGGGLNLTELKDSLKEGFEGQFASLAAGVTLFSYLLGSAGTSSSATGGVYQTLLIIIVSLATIWLLRQLMADNKVRVRDSFYKGMFPLVPFVLVLLVIGLQLIPLMMGSWVYSTVVNNAIAVNTLEKSIWLIFFLLLAVLSLYMIASSLFALYIVTLPDMTPMKALRSARQLVLHRRFLVLRKVLFLPLVLLILAAIIMIPLIVFLTPIAEWVFFGLSMFVVVLIHSYMYTLYRELL